MNGTDEVAGPRGAAASEAGGASAGGVSPEPGAPMTVPLGIVSFFRKPPKERPALLLLKADAEDAGEAAVELAEALAREGHRIVLCDLSLSSPELHRVLGVPNDEGMTDLFEFGASLRRVTTRVRGGSLFFAPAGVGGANPERLARHPRWQRLLAGATDAEATLLLYAPADLPGIADIARRVHSAAVIGTAARADAVAAELPDGCALLDRVPTPGGDAVASADDEDGAAGLAGFSPFDTDYAADYHPDAAWEPYRHDVAVDEEELDAVEELGDADQPGAVEELGGTQEPGAVEELGGTQEPGAVEELSDAEADLVEAAASDSVLAALGQAEVAAVDDEADAGGGPGEAGVESARPARGAPPVAGEQRSGATLEAPPSRVRLEAPPPGPTTEQRSGAKLEAPPAATSPAGPRDAPPARPARAEPAVTPTEGVTEAPDEPDAGQSPRVRTGLWIGLGILVALLLVLFWLLMPDAGAEPNGAEPAAAAPARAEDAIPAVPQSGEIIPLGYTVAIEAHLNLDTARARLGRLRRAEEGVPFLITPFLLDGAVYYRVMAGPYADSAEAVVVRDVLFRDGRKATVGDWDVRPTSYGFLVDELDDADAASERAEQLTDAGIPAYAVPVSPDGATRVYAGAFELREQAPVLQEPLRAAGLDPSLVRISGWVSSQ